MLKQHGVSGTWQAAPAGTGLVLVLDYVAGLLVTTSAGADEVRAPPEAFRSTTGQSGTELLEQLLRPPSPRDLRFGAIRESIATASSAAVHGHQETRAWDGPNDYVVDTGEGSCGIVRFIGDRCVGALINYDPWRELDTAKAILALPPSLRDTARELVGLPMLNSAQQLGISAMFWGEDARLRAHEPWPAVYRFGGELLRRELLSDELWAGEAGAYFDLNEHVLAIIRSLAERRAVSAGGLDLTNEEFRAIVPDGSPHHDEAVELLDDAGFRRP